MVDDDHDVVLAALVGDLVDADAPQAHKQILPPLGLGADTLHHAPDRAPGDTHELGGRRLGGVHAKPGDLVLEGGREAGAVPCPGHGGDHDAVSAAENPRRIGLQIDQCGQRRFSPAFGRTFTISASCSIDTSSMTAPSAPSSFFHTLASRTSSPLLSWGLDLEKPKP